MVLLYKLAAALVEPISDKRITEMLSGVGDSLQMLLKVIFAVALLFLLTVAIVAVTT